jgi:hypothetical protein|tara:strand:- start:3 stop:455 length:453 start_codon:yes stop_codon:yes gene_type:complete
MAKKIFDAKKLAVKYDEALTKRPSKLVRREVLAEADELIEVEGSTVEVNRNISSAVDITYLPSLHSIMTNTYSVIDGEVRRLLRSSNGSGLDNFQSRHLGTLTRSLCQLAQLEMGIKEQNELEYMADDKLQELADRAFKRIGGKLKEGEE